MNKNYRLSRHLLLYISLIIGLAFLGIAFIFIIEAPAANSSFNDLLIRLRESYEDLTNHGLLRTVFPLGIFIALAIGAPHIFGGLLLVARMKFGIFLLMIASIILIVLSSVAAVKLYDTYIVWINLSLGIIELIVSYICYVSYYKYCFYFNELDYTDINRNNKELLVVFYSRDRYIKKYAYEYADRHKCNIYEIRTKEDFHTNKGLLKLFYRTLFNKETEVEEVEIDLTQYKKVYLITGVIINNIASPVIDFCKKSSGMGS